MISNTPKFIDALLGECLTLQVPLLGGTYKVVSNIPKGYTEGSPSLLEEGERLDHRERQ